MLGFPAKSTLKFVLAGYQNGGIAWAAGGEFAWNLAAGDAFGGVEDFEDGETAAVADIEGFAGDAADGFEGADVGIRDVQDVYVVADAGAIGSRVVRAKNINVGDDAEGGVENFGEEMRFHPMGFATFGGGAGGVEIAERGVVQASVGAVVGEDFFEADFGFAVGVDGVFRMVFRDGDGVRLAVGGGGGGED